MTDTVQEQTNELQIERVWMYSPFPANCDPYTAETLSDVYSREKYRVLPWKFEDMASTIWCHVSMGHFVKVAAVGIDTYGQPALFVEQHGPFSPEKIGTYRQGKYEMDLYVRIDHLAREQQWAWHNVRVAYCFKRVAETDRRLRELQERKASRSEIKEAKAEVERWRQERVNAETRVRAIGNTINFEKSDQIVVNRFGIQKPQELIISSLVLSNHTQSREAMNEEQIQRYVEDLKRGDVFPPIQVFTDGSKNYVTDGFHRTEAHRRAGRETIMAMVQVGSFDEATWDSYGANRTNGLQRTRADIARATQNALKHKNAAKLSDQQIAKHIGVDPKTVAKYRAQLVAAQEIPEVTERVGADGKTYNTNRIGARTPEKPNTSIRATLENFKFSAQHFYAIDHEEKIVYSAPFIKLESVREWNYLLRGYSGTDVLAMREAGKLERYTFDTNEPPVLKLPTPKPAEPVTQPESQPQPEPTATDADVSHFEEIWIGDLLPDKSYIITPGSLVPNTPHLMDKIIAGPFESATDAIQYRDRYNSELKTPTWAATGKTILEMREKELADLSARRGAYKSSEVVEYIQPHIMWWEQGGLRYSPLMAATCKACYELEWTKLPIVGWKPAETPRLWICPKCGRRKADHLMRIAVQETLFNDELPTPQADPEPQQMSEWEIGGKRVTLQEWQEYVEANAVYPPLVEPESDIVLAHFASFFTALKYFDEHPVLTRERLKTVRGKYDNEAIDLLDSIIAVGGYDIEQEKGGDKNKRK
jgi:hypothetical protein